MTSSFTVHLTLSIYHRRVRVQLFCPKIQFHIFTNLLLIPPLTPWYQKATFSSWFSRLYHLFLFPLHSFLCPFTLPILPSSCTQPFLFLLTSCIRSWRTFSVKMQIVSVSYCWLNGFSSAAFNTVVKAGKQPQTI